MASQKIESPELTSLLDSANSAPRAVAAVHITFLAICAYVLIVAFGTTDLDLLVGKGINQTTHWLAKVRRLDHKGQVILSKPAPPGVLPYIRQGTWRELVGTSAPVPFKGRYLRRANLEDAVLFGANLEEAHLQGARLKADEHCHGLNELTQIEKDALSNALP